MRQADYSKSSQQRFACVCGASVVVDQWDLVDSRHRVDLVDRAVNGSLLRHQCSSCHRELERQGPLGILHPLGDEHVLLMFYADSGGPPPSSVDFLVDETDIPALAFPFEALPVIVPRDLDEDLANPEGAISEAEAQHGTAIGERYANALGSFAALVEGMRLGPLINKMAEFESAAEFAEFVQAEPAALSDEMQDHLSRVGGIEPFRASMQAIADLLKDARDDPTAAWDKHMALWASGPDESQTRARMNEIEACHEQHRWADAIPLSKRLLGEAEEHGAGDLAGFAHAHLGVEYLHAGDGSRAENLDKAVDHLEQAARLTITVESRVGTLNDLGAAYLRRINGDRRDNFNQALDCLKRALTVLKQEDLPRQLSTVQTNLAHILQQREYGDRAGDLRESREYALAALTHRSPELDVEDWAYTMLNLGGTLELLSDLGVADRSDAVHAYEDVLNEAARLVDRTLVGQANLGLGRALLASARDAESEGDHRRATELRSRGQDSLEAAVPNLEGRDELRHAQTLAELADVLRSQGEMTAAIAVAENALKASSADFDPREHSRISWLLGDLHADLEDWPAAADAFRSAVDAAEVAFLARLDSQGRAVELQGRRNLERWAAFAVARAGDARGAALILEGGRARELRRRIEPGDAEWERLVGLPLPLQDAYREATTALARSAYGDDATGASRKLHAAVASIRAVAGFEDFGVSVQWEEIAGATEPQHPLVYVNPTPYGTLLLLVSDGQDRPDAILLDGPSSEEVLDALRFEAIDSFGDPDSYLGTASGMTPSGSIDKGLRFVLPWLGERLAHPLADELAKLGASGVTLVLCGPLGLSPLHAATWSEGGGDVCLLDHFDVRYAPSAALQSLASQRSNQRADVTPRLVAVGNPAGAGLQSSEGEVLEIGENFDPDQTLIAVEAEATKAFLLGNASDATHLHLACHGRGDLWDPEETALVLADGELKATELAGIQPLAARLAVASACQTAIAELNNLPDEVFSVATVLIAAGAACAIASLWSVNDYTTALLMTKLYQELFSDDHPRPHVALKRAQLWLRDLDAGDEGAFLDEHPHLRDEFARLSRGGTPPGERGNRGSSTPSIFESPKYWAPFIAVGA